MKNKKRIAIGLVVILLSFVVGSLRVYSWEGSTGNWTPGYFEEASINATTEFYRAGDNYTALVETLISTAVSESFSSAPPSADTYTIIYNSTSSEYEAYDNGGVKDHSGANFVTVHNDAVTAASATGGGIVRLGEYSALCATPPLIGKSDVHVIGSGDGSGPGKGTRLVLTVNDAVLYQMTGGSNMGLMNMKLVATGQTGTTLIDLDTTYGRLDKLFLGNSDYCLNASKTTTTDNWITDMYILDFGIIGMQIYDMHDTHVDNLNIGTSVAGGGPLACIKWDEGGTGSHFNNIHLWSSTACSYGLLMGSMAGLYQFEAQFSNVEIEGSPLEVGIYTSERADMNMFSNLRFKNVDCAIQNYGDYNQFYGVFPRNCDDNAIEMYGDNWLIDGGWVHGSGKHGIVVSSAYQTWSPGTISDVTLTSNGLDSAETYYDIHIYHTKQIAISGGSSSGTSVLCSIYADDSDDLMINGFYAWDEEILFNSVDGDTHAVNCWNGTQGFVADGP